MTLRWREERENVKERQRYLFLLSTLIIVMRSQMGLYACGPPNRGKRGDQANKRKLYVLLQYHETNTLACKKYINFASSRFDRRDLGRNGQQTCSPLGVSTWSKVTDVSQQDELISQLRRMKPRNDGESFSATAESWHLLIHALWLGHATWVDVFFNLETIYTCSPIPRLVSTRCLPCLK